MLPFFTWTILDSFIAWRFSTFISILLHPGNGLLFLWDLFFICAFYYMAIFAKNKLHCCSLLAIIIVFVVLCGIVAFTKLRVVFDLQRIMRLFPFYVLGSYMRKANIERFFNNKTILFLLLSFYAIIGFFWFPNGMPEWLAFSPIFNLVTSSFFYRLLVSFTGCMLCFSAGIIVEPYLNKNFLIKIGTKTLGIYAIHLFIIHRLISFMQDSAIPYNIFNLVGITVLLVSVSLLMIFLFEKQKWSRLLFLGARN